MVHLHGGRTRPESDGYPTDLVPPAGWPDAGHDMHGMGGMSPMAPMHDPRAVTTRLTREYTYPKEQRPTMLWQHDHRMDFTAPAIWRGLAGLHLVRDDAEEALGLPSGCPPAGASARPAERPRRWPVAGLPASSASRPRSRSAAPPGPIHKSARPSRHVTFQTAASSNH